MSQAQRLPAQAGGGGNAKRPAGIDTFIAASLMISCVCLASSSSFCTTAAGGAPQVLDGFRE